MLDTLFRLLSICNRSSFHQCPTKCMFSLEDCSKTETVRDAISLIHILYSSVCHAKSLCLHCEVPDNGSHILLLTLFDVIILLMSGKCKLRVSSLCNVLHIHATLSLLNPKKVQIFSSATCSQTSMLYFLSYSILSFTPAQDSQIYSLVYFNLCVFRQEDKR
jgi:hypothetical protein